MPTSKLTRVLVEDLEKRRPQHSPASGLEVSMPRVALSFLARSMVFKISAAVSDSMERRCCMGKRGLVKS
jgi:hypothetical protein